MAVLTPKLDIVVMITELNRKMLSNFYIKNHWNHLYHHLYHLFEITYKSIFYNLNITLKKWFISKTINTRGNFIRKCPLGPCGLPEVCVWQFFIFTVTATIQPLLVFSDSDASTVLTPWYLFPFCSVIILGNIIKWESWCD